MTSISSCRLFVSGRTSSVVSIGPPKALQGRIRVTLRVHAEQQQSDAASTSVSEAQSAGSTTSAKKFSWTHDGKATTARDDGRLVMELPVAAIRRPLGLTRRNDPDKVEALMESIREIGLQEPIDVLEVDGVYYGFSGCHRFEAHQRLGAETIRCRVRKATKEVLKMHLM